MLRCRIRYYNVLIQFCFTCKRKCKNIHTLSYRNIVIGILIDCRSFRAIVANAAIQPFYTTNGVSETVICVAATVINSIISPSILSADFSNLERDCRMLIAVCSMFLSPRMAPTGFMLILWFVVSFLSDLRMVILFRILRLEPLL